MRRVVVGDATLYHGDCLDVFHRLPRVDVVVTSPPYNHLQQGAGGGLFKNSTTVAKWHAAYEDRMPERVYQRYLVTRLQHAYDLAKGLMWVNHKVRHRRGQAIHPLQFLTFPLYCEVIWDRGGSMALNSQRFATSHEGIWAFGHPHYWNRQMNTRLSVWRVGPESDPTHPCVTPAKLIEPIIVASCPHRGVVLDPFCGTARVGHVALRLGRRFIGIEKKKSHFDDAVDSMRAIYR
jgi:DNA modification methylase